MPPTMPDTSASSPEPAVVRDVRTAPFVARVLDGALDGLVLAFALWTLGYEVVLAAQVSAYVPAAAWVVLAAVVVPGTAWVEVRRAEIGPGVGAAGGPVVRPRPLPAWLLPGYGALVVVAVLLREPLGVLPLVLLAVGGLGVGLLRRRARAASDGPRDVDTDTHAATDADDAPDPEVAVSTLHHAVAAAVSVGLGVLCLFLVRLDEDDVFYVNRGTWVAEHGVPSLRDTMFGPETIASSYGGGLPLTSVETLYGALAHLLGLRNGTVTYLVVAPLLSFLAGWALWRLVRAWAPRLPLVAFVVAVGFVLVSAESVTGNYSVGRIWQGKVTATAVLLPLVLLYLGRLVQRPGPHAGRRCFVLLGAAGVGFVGLTSAAPLMAVSVAGAAVLAALLVRSRPLATGAGCFLLAPLAAGVVVALGPAAVGGEDPVAMPAAAALAVVLGPDTVVVLLSVVALLAALVTVRPAVAVLAGCCVLAAFVALLPGFFDAVNLATGAGPVAWRLLLVAPVATLVGLLGAAAVHAAATAPVLARRRPVGLAVLAIAAVAVAVSGTPQWSGAVGARLTATPQWKLDTTALDDLQELQDLEDAGDLETGPGPWMLPPDHMEALAIWTTERFAVVPRSFYLVGIAEPDPVTISRLRLYLTWSGKDPSSPAQVRADLRRLGVSMACASADDATLLDTLEKASEARLRPVGSLLCVVRAEPRTD